MSDSSTAAMSSWIGTLARGGVVKHPIEEAGLAVAAFVVGEDKLDELRAWFEGPLRRGCLP